MGERVGPAMGGLATSKPEDRFQHPGGRALSSVGSRRILARGHAYVPRGAGTPRGALGSSTAAVGDHPDALTKHSA